MKYEVNGFDYVAGVTVLTPEVFEGDSELECLLKAQEKLGSIGPYKRLPDDTKADAGS
jgi:hypothetical protein